MEQNIAQLLQNPPELWPLLLLALNVVALLLMAYDKFQARRGGWRTPESTFFGLALIGATPAILVAMEWFRHKRQKRSFYMRIWMILVLQIGLFAMVQFSA